MYMRPRPVGVSTMGMRIRDVTRKQIPILTSLGPFPFVQQSRIPSGLKGHKEIMGMRERDGMWKQIPRPRTVGATPFQ